MVNRKRNICWRRSELARQLKRQGGLCFYCGDPIVLHKHGPILPSVDQATFDHVIPVSRKGHMKAPGVASCHVCNVIRGAKPFLTFWLSTKETRYLVEVSKLKSRILTRELKKFGV